MNITTWADSREEASAKIEQYLTTAGWHLVQIDQADIIDEDAQYSIVLTDMIDRTRNSPNAITLGTFHTYKSN